MWRPQVKGDAVIHALSSELSKGESKFDLHISFLDGCELEKNMLGSANSKISSHKIELSRLLQ